MSAQSTKRRTNWRFTVSSLARLAMICALEHSASAEVGVLKVKSGFNEDAGEVYTPYILASDYSIRRTWGYDCRTGWETVLTGLTYAIDIAVPGDMCVIWGVGSGDVWCYNEWGGGWTRYAEPSGTTFVKLAATTGLVYAMTSSGTIYRYCFGDIYHSPGWAVYANAVQAKELATAQWDLDGVYFLAPPAAGSSYTAKMVPWQGGPVTAYGGPRGTKIAVDNNHMPWVSSGSTIYKWDGSRWRSAWASGYVYEMDINQQMTELNIVSDPAIGSGHTLWSHDLTSGGWYRCVVP